MPAPDALERAAGARTFWSGTITFGLVSIPVALMAANRSAGVSMRMVSPEGRPLTRRYFTSAGDDPLEADEIVRGYEVEKDQFVVLDDEELERLAPERTRDIDLRLFVKAEEIDPMHFQRAYYLAPTGGSNKAYRLLAKVMEETGRAGVATFVMRAKEYLVAILAENGILRAETLRFADELRTPEDVGLPEPAEPDASEVARIDREIAKLVEKRLDPAELEDDSAGRLREIARRKAERGEGVVRIDPEAVPADDEDGEGVIDLMAVLKRSLEQGSDDEAPRRRKSAHPADDLEGKTRAELYEEAKKLDIEGRSRMSRDELAEAIRRVA